ncbi:MAG: hypothetical protein IT289_10685, partial [Oligoflexia bacterium]|nr:hypothetical protein [Oligoflexia bacterium]
MRFVEKPGPEKAEQFINEGTYCWNAGIFIAKSSTIIDEVHRVQPAVAAIMDQIIKKPRMLKSLYKKVPKLPFDIAIMERTHKGAVVFGDFGWNDLGSWPALLEVFGTNHPAGHTSTEKNLLSVDSSGNIISRSSQKLLALVGVQDLIFVETENAILISKIQEAQKIKTVVEELSRTAKTRNKFT